MCKRLKNILEKKEIIFSLQLGQKYSTTHALIHVADRIRHETDKGNYVCGIFVDFQNAIDTLDTRYYWKTGIL